MPAATEATTEPSGRNKIGVLLRETRQSFGGDIGEIAATLRIRAAYLIAIEEAQFDRLPAPVYATGFVRAYANHLGLDGEEAVRRFKQETTNFESPRGLSFPVPLGERSIPGGTVVLAALILAVCGYGLWYYVSTGERSRPERVSVVPPELKPLAGNVAQPPAPAPVASAPDTSAATPSPSAAVSEPPPASVMSSAATNAPAPMSAPPVTALAADAVVAPTPPPASPSTSTAPATQVASATPPAVVTPPAGSSPTAPPTATASAGTAAPTPDQPRVFGAVGQPARIILRARKDSWIQVREGDHIVSERTLRPGDIYRVPDRPGLILHTGNGAGFDIEVDGKKAPSLGAAVRRNVALDPARLAAGTALPD